MHTRLFIADKNIRKVQILLQRLTNPGNIAMTKDSQDTRKELDLLAIAMDILILQKSDDSSW